MANAARARRCKYPLRAAQENLAGFPKRVQQLKFFVGLTQKFCGKPAGFLEFSCLEFKIIADKTKRHKQELSRGRRP
ncbi:hypothetical protein [Methylobacterium goesingense]|uniref:Uncharacterized protein n=1 Tax=Methylobacterium goesingense TaxID=243690 RepID=A0ABV2KZY6_9HYPH|nr:hypothetical protein [Methylobacterium goesingense]